MATPVSRVYQDLPAPTRLPWAVACLLLAGLAAQPATANTGSRLTVGEAQQVVNEHNRVRREAGLNVMVGWDNGIAQYAQDWADHLAATNTFRHRSPNAYGENIFWGSAGYGVVNAVRSWESEKSLYRGEAINGSNYQRFGHYTQMIWSRTTRIGCGKAKSASGQVYIVCNYSPAGNVMGQRPLDGPGGVAGSSGGSGGSTGGIGGSTAGTGPATSGGSTSTGPRGPWPDFRWRGPATSITPAEAQQRIEEARRRMAESLRDRRPTDRANQLLEAWKEAQNRRARPWPTPIPNWPRTRHVR